MLESRLPSQLALGPPMPEPPEPPRSALFLRIRILHGEVAAFGTGKAALLEAIGACHSIAAAGRSLGLSYSKTRRLVDEMNQSFAKPLVESAKGGLHGGGARMTETGRKVLAAFRTMEACAQASMQDGLRAIQRELVQPPSGTGRPTP